MKKLRLLQSESGLLGWPLFQQSTRHRCPVCRKLHDVPAARAQFAYGRQLTCGPDCEAARRRRIRAACRLVLMAVPGSELAEPGTGRPATAAREKASLKVVTTECEPTSVALQTKGTDRECPDFPQDMRRVAPAREKNAVISVIVASTDVLRLRRAIFEVGRDSVGILKTAPVPRSSRVRVFISMKIEALESIMTAIMRSVTTCEFGRIART